MTATAGPFLFHVDRTAPAAPLLAVAPDPAAPSPGWWGHGPVALAISTTTANDVASSRLRVYAPSGAVLSDETTAGALVRATIPAAAFTGPGSYGADIVQCDGASHCTTSARALIRWDGAAPATGAEGSAPPLGLLAARDGAHMRWPDAAGAGASGLAGAYTGIGATPAAAIARALAAGSWETGVSGTTETAVPAAAIHGAGQVCLAIRPLSGAGIAAVSASVRCAPVDEQPPVVAITGAVAWSGGAQTVEVTADDAGGASLARVLLDGIAVAAPGGGILISGEGTHVLRALARDSAGNETVAERSLGVDATAPAVGTISADFTAREVRVGVADALSGVGSAEVRLAGALLETRISVDGSTAIARVPAGIALDGAAVSGARPGLLLPGQRGRAQRDPDRAPAARPARPGGRERARDVGASSAAAPARIELWAYPKGREPPARRHVSAERRAAPSASA